MPTKSESNASFRKPRFVFLVLAVALVFGAVCVGGVSGATHYVYANHNLADIVDNANDGDEIVIMEDYVIKEQVWLGPEDKNEVTTPKSLTITNEPGKHVTIKSDLTGGVDDRTLFIITGGTLTIEGGNQGGSLTITTDYNGRAFDVNYDGRFRYLTRPYLDNVDSTLVMNSNVNIKECGFDDGGDNDGGAIYVRYKGDFVMNGGWLLNNHAGAGGAIIVDCGTFTMNGGLIRGNQALDNKEDGFYRDSIGGGGVYITDDSGVCNLMGGVIYGNTAEGLGSVYQQVYGGKYNSAEPWISLDGIHREYYTINQAYKAALNNGQSTINIYLHSNIDRDYDEIITVNVPLTILPATQDLSKVLIGKNIDLTITESSESKSMFYVSSGGHLAFQNNGGYSITISGSNYFKGNGGAVYIDGGSFTLSEGVTMSGLKAENGGAIYLNSGTCTLAGSASITGCAASGKGGAVYVADGTFTVKDSASVDASNDVYLEDGEVITAESGYKGTVGKITMPSYEEGTEVVNVKTDSTGYPNQFTLTADSKDELGEKILVLKTGNPNHLVISINPNYKITIPPNLIVNSDEMEYIVATILEIPKNARVDVKVTGEVNSNGDFTLKYMDGSDDLNVELPYDVMTDGKVVKNNGVVATFSRTKKDDVPLNAVCTGTPVYAGNYEDRLTFTFVYVSGETGNTR